GPHVDWAAAQEALWMRQLLTDLNVACVAIKPNASFLCGGLKLHQMDPEEEDGKTDEKIAKVKESIAERFQVKDMDADWAAAQEALWMRQLLTDLNVAYWHLQQFVLGWNNHPLLMINMKPNKRSTINFSLHSSKIEHLASDSMFELEKLMRQCKKLLQSLWHPSYHQHYRGQHPPTNLTWDHNFWQKGQPVAPCARLELLYIIVGNGIFKVFSTSFDGLLVWDMQSTGKCLKSNKRKGTLTGRAKMYILSAATAVCLFAGPSYDFHSHGLTRINVLRQQENYHPKNQTHKGVSLNACLAKGPDSYMNNLVEVQKSFEIQDESGLWHDSVNSTGPFRTLLDLVMRAVHIEAVFGPRVHDEQRRRILVDGSLTEMFTRSVSQSRRKSSSILPITGAPKPLVEGMKRGSRWRLRRVDLLEIHIGEYQPLRGKGYEPLSETIRKKKAIINMKNDDDECFKWAVTRALNPTDIHPERISEELREQSGKLDWEGIEFPTPLSNIKKFEKNNNIGVSVFGLDGRYKIEPQDVMENFRKRSTYLPYMDANNLYGWAMSQPLPIKDFKWMDDEELGKWTDYSCILEVDLEYTDDLHDKHNEYPLAPGGIMVNEVRKLVSNLNDKEKYVLHHKNLEQYLSLGLKLTKIHRGVKFHEKPWMKGYIQLNTDLRTNGTTDFEKDFFKLMNNSVFGETMENVRNRVDIRLVNNEEKWNKLAQKHNYKSATIFSENLVAVHMMKTSAKLNKPIYLGMSILDISKTLMYDFHYNYIKPKYGDDARLLFTDTDSLCYEIKTEDFFKDISEDVYERFDTSNLGKDHPSGIPTGVNKKVIGMMKLETGARQIEEFIIQFVRSMNCAYY
ncbi:Hypothetical predicted protein, partial [Paramuricea clavata]